MRWLLALALPLAIWAGAWSYRVQPGDTLYSLARRYRTTVAAIQRANGLTGDLIRVGQVLHIPGHPQAADFQALVRPFLGAPYRFGGTGEGGFDCSGLVVRVYAGLGVRLPRTAAGQFAALPPASRLRPGDLVFFSFKGHRIDHVGIYLGGGRFVHASNRGVVIEDLDLPWYRRAYRGARRVPLGYDGRNERAQDHTPGAPPR